MAKVTRRFIFGKIGSLALALVLSMGAMGVIYAKWSDTVFVDTTITTGSVSGVLSGNSGHPGTAMTCGTSGNVFTVTITNAVANTDYYCAMTVRNNGTIPIKIKSITFAPSPGMPSYVTVTLPPTIAVGVQIEPGPGAAKVGPITVSGAKLGDNFSFTETFVFVPWNRYP